MGFFSSIGKAFKGLGSSVLGLAGDVVGGVLGLGSTKDTNDAQVSLAREQMAYQKELAQNQIQWRVEDAKKAGLHPLAGLGVSSASYSPVSTDLTPPDYSFLGDMGQNLNRAIQQGKTQKEREQALARQDQLDGIMMRKANAEADLAETAAASERLRLQRELFPPSPVANQNVDPQLPPDSTFTRGTIPLLGAARLGNTLFLHYNPEIADAVSEDAARSIAATIATTGQLERVMPELARKFSERERRALKNGDADLKVINPYQVQFLWKPHMAARYDGNKQTVRGKIVF